MKYAIQRISNEKDKGELLRLWSEHHERKLDGKYGWMYEGNPAGKAIVVLIKDSEKNECIGCFAVFPRQVSIKGVHLRAGVAGDFLVHKEHRNLIPALKLAKSVVSIVHDGTLDLVYGFPNKNAGPVMKRAGFRCLGPYTRTAKIIRTSEKLQGMHLNRYLNRLMSPLLDVALKLVSLETWYRSKGGFVCEEVTEFDERFDKLWEKSRSRFQVVGERTSESLTWKFLRKPGAEYCIYAIFNSNRTEVKGYIVYDIDEDSIAVRDFVFPEEQKAVRVFVAHFLRHARKASPISVVMQYLGNEEDANVMRRFGFVRRESDWHTYYHCNAQVLKRFPALEDSRNWLLTNLDLDN